MSLQVSPHIVLEIEGLKLRLGFFLFQVESPKKPNRSLSLLLYFFLQPYAPIWRSRGCLKTNRRSEEPERQRGYLLEFPAGNSRRLLPPDQVRGRKDE